MIVENWEKIGTYEKFGDIEGIIHAFYNEFKNEKVYVWNKLDGSSRLLDEEMYFKYDNEDVTQYDQEIDDIDELMNNL